MIATALITLVVIAGVGFAIHSLPVERGTTGQNAASDQHNISKVGWFAAVVISLILLGTASHPRVYPFFKGCWEWAYSESDSSNASASASASASTSGGVDYSQEGVRLMNLHFGNLQRNGKKITGFSDIGDRWTWYVLDTSIHATEGQPVRTGEYEVTDLSVTSVTIFIARQNADGSWEKGPSRPFTLQ